ncbi:hypothetical protein, partial [Mycobacterium marinum]|uniref:hypothetical protein n=1 Tax=Mycobacterium marinum TaxID=1781 RepID=UPI001CA5E972
CKPSEAGGWGFRRGPVARPEGTTEAVCLRYGRNSYRTQIIFDSNMFHTKEDIYLRVWHSK